MMIVDGLLVSVGSTNFDNRSFRLNDEANLNVLDAAFAKAQTAVFEQDKARSRRVTLDLWRKRPLGERIWRARRPCCGRSSESRPLGLEAEQIRQGAVYDLRRYPRL